MADRDQVKAQVVESEVLDAAELAPTPAQEKKISEGCIANALARIPPQNKDGLRSSVSAVQADLALAIDRIKKRRSRMASQMQNLIAEKSRIAGGTARIAALYTFAEPAISACPAAAESARLAKEGSDLVHARLNEVEYQMTLINTGDLELASEERNLSGAMSSLDEMVLSLR